jgi:hypothetical protein
VPSFAKAPEGQACLFQKQNEEDNLLFSPNNSRFMAIVESKNEADCITRI